MRGLASPEAAKALLKELPSGVMDIGVRELMTRALADLSGLNGSRHDPTLSHVRDLVKYGAAGLAGTGNALKALQADFVEAVWDDPERGSREVAGAEFDRMKVNGAQLAAAKSAEELANFGAALKAVAPKGIWHPDTLWPDEREHQRFRLVSAKELAEPVEPMRWLVRGIWPAGSAGVLAGEKKSMKTEMFIINKFWLEVETDAPRRWKHLEVDWTLDRDKSDPDVIAWTGVDWESTARKLRNPAGGHVDDTVAAILQVVGDHPFELTETSVLKAVGGIRTKARETFQGLKANGGILVKNCVADEGGRPVSRDRVGLGENADRIRKKRFRREELRPGVRTPLCFNRYRRRYGFGTG